MTIPLRVLLVEDSADDAALVLAELRRHGYAPTSERVETADAMRAALEGGTWDVVVSDFNLPTFSAPAALEVALRHDPDIPFIIVSGTIGEETAVASLKAGAHDFIVKDNLARLVPAVERELREVVVRRERRRALEALRESEARFHTLASAVPVGIFRVAADGVSSSYLNSRLLEITGMTQAEAAGSGWMRAIHPDDAERVAAEWAHVLATKEPWRSEHRIRRRDGSVVWVLGSAVAERDATGQATGFIGTLTDVTDLRGQADALGKRNREIRCLHDVSAALDRATEPGEVLHEVAGLLPTGLRFPEAACARITLGDVRHETAGFRETAQTLRAEIRVGDRCAGAVEVCYLEPKPDADLGPFLEAEVGLLGAIAARIGERFLRYESEKALQASEAQFRALIEHSSDLITVLDADGRNTYTSPSVKRVLGFDPEELVGTNGLERVHAEDARRFQTSFAQAMAVPGQRVGVEFRFRRHDGSWCHLEAVATNLLHDPAVRGIVVNSRDVTDRARAEEALVDSERMLSAMFDNAVDGIVLMEVGTMRLRKANGAFCRMLGYSQDEVLELSVSDIHPKESLAEVARLVELQLKGEIPTAEVPVKRKDGGIFDGAFSAAPIVLGGKTYLLAILRDVTESRRAGEALRLAEARFRALIEHAMDFVTVFGVDGRVTYTSPSVRQVLGYEPDERLGQAGFDRVHPDDAPRVKEAFAAAVADRGLRSTQTFRYQHKDGSWRVLEGTVSNLLDHPAVDGLVINLRDVTERMKAEETLRREQSLVNTLMENIPDSIYFKDASSRFIRINRFLARLFGLSDPAEAVGKTDFDFFAPEHAQAALKTEQQVISTGEPAVNVEEMETWPDRPNTWVSTTKMPLRDPTGAIVGTFGISRDITRRKHVEETLRRSEADYRRLVEDAPLGIVRVGLDGRMVAVNRVFVKMLGYESGEEVMRLNSTTDIFADPEDRVRLIGQATEHGEATAEFPWKRKDGSVITVRAHARVCLSPAGEIEHIDALVEDVTAHRALENQFRQAQRMEAVGRLAGGVAHDFNNILTAITGYSELLLDDLESGDPRRRRVTDIRTAAERAAALTRQLLAFSRKQMLQTRVLDLNAVVRGLEKMLQRLIGEDVRLETALDAGAGAVRADPGQIEQIIVNLVVNARDAMPDGGRLTIETANTVLGEEYASTHAGVTPGTYVVLAVSDTGCGMDAETQAHIFEPFFTTKEQGKGTGLGLATVYGIVKQSGGNVFVYSEPGRGATFKIYLPRVDAPVEAEGGAPAAGPAAGCETVLVAEDDAAVREVVAAALTQKGYRVLQASDGPAALEVARGEPGDIHLLVTDLVMPGMPGQDLAEALVALRPGIAVLFMSGYTDDAVVRHRVLEAGIPYLQKPFTPRALAFKVREVLDRAGSAAAS